MSERPPPLTPPGCDMSGNDWFPLYFRRLRNSRWWRRASDLARARNVMLWGEAYQSVPAGSLPDDDDELAEAAGFGFDAVSFLTAKNEIMAPWVLCSDGRWYHPTVCEAALEAWNRLSERRRADRERKAAERSRVRAGSVVTSKMSNVTRDTVEKGRDIATHTYRTGQDRKEANASLSPDGDETPTKGYPSDFEACWQAYPHVKGRSSKSKSLGAWRRLRQATRSQLPSAIARYACDGREPNQDCGAPAMERWLKDERWLDWLADEPSPGRAAFPGPAEIRAAVVREMGEDWTQRRFDYCRWRDLPDKAVLSDNGFVVDEVRKTIGPLLESFGARVLLEKPGEAA